MLYHIFRGLFRVFFRLFYRYEVVGNEHIPSTGPVMLCCNHISNLDPPILGCGTDRKVSFMAKQELFKIPVVSFLIRSFGAFPVKRGVTDKQALKKSLSILKEGGTLGIFPEGTRSKTGRLGKAFSGVGLFALKENADVIPTAVIGPYKLFKGVKIVYGQPIDLEDLRQDKVNSEKVQEATDRIMTGIQQLLDEHKNQL
ncbi:lysophospholipid acyltransferase family protein [Caldalkalibacillus salinus]|uniref:lysophospholipid acyltransferase family protein n=1 Tax=Caldalkalibacillus salinus TaxID=2803787 RepID=UPI001923C276|nr:lysophospholipid acyltransferase family protein [Caldalkalibacillus salinus]